MNEKGVALPAVITVLLVVGLLGAGAIGFASAGAESAKKLQANQTAQEMAENGLEAAKFQLASAKDPARYDGRGAGDYVWAEAKGGKKLRFSGDEADNYTVVKIWPADEPGKFDVNSVGFNGGTKRSLSAVLDADAPQEVPPGTPDGGTTTPPGSSVGPPDGGTPPGAPPAAPPGTTPANAPPEGAPDFALVPMNGSVKIRILENDADPDGDPISRTANTKTARGAVSCSGESCTYRPSPGFTGDDSFLYSIADGKGGKAENIRVDVEVAAPAAGSNREPVARDDGPRGVYTMKEDAPERRLPVMVNDSDPDDDPIRIVSRGKAKHGVARCYAAYCTYEPAANFSGNDQFTYTIKDRLGKSSTATVRLKVTPVAEPQPAPDPKPKNPGCGGSSGQSGTNSIGGNGGSATQNFGQNTSCTTSGPNGTVTMSCDQAARQVAAGGEVSQKIRQECNLRGGGGDGEQLTCKQAKEMYASGRNVGQELRQRCDLGGRR